MRVDTKKYAEPLKSVGIPNPLSEAAKIIDLVCGTKGGEFTLSRVIEISQEDDRKIEELVAKRVRRIPFSRLVDAVPFADIEIETSNGVYAPTPETENMIDHALALLEKRATLRLLDLGSGSGCILLALLHALPKATGLGIDNAEKAIELGQKNAARNSLEDRADFKLGEWSQEISEAFDVVVSNPPRAATGDIAHLLPEVRDHDPRVSLDGGADGMNFFRKLAEDFHRIAKKGSYGFFQVGPAQGQVAEQIFYKQGFRKTQMKLNYMGQASCLIVVNEKAR
jgi:release factor glutamine methyltransferase